MAEKASSPADDDVVRLRARVKELEDELTKRDTRRDSGKDKNDEPSTTRRVADSFSDVRRSKRDAADRMVRGVTLASVEAVRVFADSVSSFADNVIRRNEGRDGEGRSVRDMATRLPEDIATSMADAVDQFVDIPRRAADRYSKVHREGEKEHDDSKVHREREKEHDRR
jgi:hypothetical protein